MTLMTEQFIGLELAGALAKVDDYQLSGWTMHDDYRVRATISVDFPLTADEVLGQYAVFDLPLADMQLGGIVIGMSLATARLLDEQVHRYHVTMVSPLWQLDQQQHHKVWVEQDALAIAQEFLGEAFTNVKVNCETPPVRLMTVQFEESDGQFVRRILAREGISLLSYCEDGAAVVELVNDMATLAEAAPQQLFDYKPGAGMNHHNDSGLLDRDHLVVRDVQSVNQLAHGDVSVDDYDYAQPTQSLFAQRVNTDTLSTSQSSEYGHQILDQEDAKRFAKQLAHENAWKQTHYVLTTNSPPVRPGAIVSVQADSSQLGFEAVAEMGEVYVLRCDSETVDSKASGNGSTCDHTTKLLCVPVGTPYHAPYKRRQPVYGVISATISNEVDETGQYRVRFPFDQSGSGDDRASRATRLMQPFNGADHGMHFPLAQGTEVAVSFEQGDIDRPIILGALNNEQAPSVTSNANPRHNLIRTRGNSEFLFDDTPDAELIRLNTADEKNKLVMDAASGNHSITLATIGDMVVEAGKTMTIDVGDSMSVNVSDKYNAEIRGEYLHQTTEGSMSFNSEANMTLTATGETTWHTREGDFSQSVNGKYHLEVAKGQSVQVNEGDYQLVVEKGGLTLQAKNNITFIGEGGGAITLQQGKGIVEIDKKGNLTINAPKVEITADKINLKAGSIGNN